MRLRRSARSLAVSLADGPSLASLSMTAPAFCMDNAARPPPARVVTLTSTEPAIARNGALFASCMNRVAVDHEQRYRTTACHLGARGGRTSCPDAARR